MPHVTEKKHIRQTRIVEKCPHCEGPIFAHEVMATENTWAHLAYRCDQCGTQWAHGGLVQSIDGFISDSRMKFLSATPEDPDEPEDVLVLARKLKAALEYCTTPPYERDLWLQASIAKTLLERKDVLATTVFTERSTLEEYLQNMNYEQGRDRVLVREANGTDQLLHCTDPDGDWWIQLVGNEDDYNDGAQELKSLIFPVTVINPVNTL